MLRWIALLLFTLPPVLTAITGKYEFPFYAYPMYSLPPDLYVYRIWVQTDQNESVRVADLKVMWPTGPNGIDGKIKDFVRGGKTDEQYQELLEFYAKRIKKFGIKNPPIKGQVTRIWIQQFNPFFPQDFKHSDYPRIIHQRAVY